MAALVKASLEIEHGESPGELGLAQPAAAIAGQPQLVESASARQDLAPTAVSGRRIAAVSTVSRGLAYHALLEYPVPAVPTVEPVIAPAVSARNIGEQGWRIVRLGAASRAERRNGPQ
jgi:acyl transferase domain-containing protein